MYMKSLDETIDFDNMRDALTDLESPTVTECVIDAIEAMALLLDSVSPVGRNSEIPARSLVIPIYRYEDAMEKLEVLLGMVNDN
jgi:hypothetical protein